GGVGGGAGPGRVPCGPVTLLGLLAPALQTPQGAGKPPAPPLRVRGVVLDAELHPCAGAAIAVIDDGDDDLQKALAQPLQRSGDNGSFAVEVPMPAGSSRRLAVGGGRHATMLCSLWNREVAGDGALDLGSFALAAGCSGAGRVRDPQGRPIDGARIEVTDLLDSREFLGDRSRMPLRSVW